MIDDYDDQLRHPRHPPDRLYCDREPSDNHYDLYEMNADEIEAMNVGFEKYGTEIFFACVEMTDLPSELLSELRETHCINSRLDCLKAFFQRASSFHFYSFVVCLHYAGLHDAARIMESGYDKHFKLGIFKRMADERMPAGVEFEDVCGWPNPKI